MLANQVPVSSIVENMSYFDCDHGHRHRPFGQGHAQQLIQDYGVGEGKIFRLPLSRAVASGSDSGEPVALSSPGGEEAQVYLALADSVVRDVYRAAVMTHDVPTVSNMDETTDCHAAARTLAGQARCLTWRTCLCACFLLNESGLKLDTSSHSAEEVGNSTVVRLLPEVLMPAGLRHNASFSPAPSSTL